MSKRPAKPRRQLPVHERPSPNHSPRQTPVDMVVLHFTGMSSLPEVLNKLCDPGSQLSAHYVVAEDGRIFRLVEEDRRAWHAGVSSWQGQRDINSRSIGIEIMNNGEVDYTREQILSVMAICKSVMERYDIPPHHIVGHSDVAPGRKVDPGPRFPWTRLASKGIGLYADPRLGDYFATAGRQGDTRYIREMLTKLGYGEDYSPNPTPPLRDIVAAFQMRFEPDVFEWPGAAGLPTRRTLALMRALVREQDRLDTAWQRRAKPAPPVTPPPPPAP